MIRLRTASALTVGALAAVTIAGTALAAGMADGTTRPSAAIGAAAGPAQSLNPSPDDSLGPADRPGPADSPSADDRASAGGSIGPDGSRGPDGRSASPAPTVGAETARLIAIRAVGGGWVTEIEQETEHGRPVYEVRVVVAGVRHDLHVDRLTGTVLRHRVDGDDSAVATAMGSENDSSHRRGRGFDDGRSDDRGSDDRGGDDHGRRGGGHGSDD